MASAQHTSRPAMPTKELPTPTPGQGDASHLGQLDRRASWQGSCGSVSGRQPTAVEAVVDREQPCLSPQTTACHRLQLPWPIPTSPVTIRRDRDATRCSCPTCSYLSESRPLPLNTSTSSQISMASPSSSFRRYRLQKCPRTSLTKPV